MVVVVLFEFSYVLAHVHHSSRETVVSFEVSNVLCLSILVGVQCCSSVRCCLFVELCVFFHFTSSYRSNRCACVSLLYCGTYAQAKPNLILSTLCFGFGCVVYIIYSAMVLCVYTLRVRSVRFGVRLLFQHKNEAGRQQLICFAAAAAAVLTTHSHNETVRQSYVRSPCIILQMD